MPPPNKPETSAQRSVLIELAAHALAFCIAAAIGAFVLSPYYAIFERDTDNASAARDAFLTAVVITGGIGPAVTLLLFWLVRLVVRRK